MQQHSTPTDLEPRPDGERSALPAIDLPPVPFAAPVRVQVERPLDSAPVQGTAIDAVLAEVGRAALTIEPLVEPTATVPAPAHAPSPAPAPVPTGEARPLHDFSIAVERRGAERRRERRDTAERRMFASEHLAAPDRGPVDPRPVTPPTAGPDSYLPAPINPRMPELPDVSALEPARPWTPPTRGQSAPAALRSTRASVHGVQVVDPPFVAVAAQTAPAPPVAATSTAVATPPPPPPTSLPGPAPAAIAALATAPAPAPTPAPAPAAPAPSPMTPASAAAPSPAADVIGSVYGTTDTTPWGQLAPSSMYADDAALKAAADAALAGVTAPDAGPAGPASAPGAGLPAPVAAAAASPAAWFGGTTMVDDDLLVWNAPGTTAPTHVAPASHVLPAAPVMPATFDLEPPARRLGVFKFLMLLVLSAGIGVGVALGINQLLG